MLIAAQTVSRIRVAARLHNLFPRLLAFLPVKRIDFLAACVANQQGRIIGC
jgi:hypothetical protein